MRQLTVIDFSEFAPSATFQRALKRWSGTILDLMYHHKVSRKNKIWAFTRKGMVSERTLRIFAIECALKALSDSKIKDEGLFKCIDAAKQYIDGKETDSSFSGSMDYALHRIKYAESAISKSIATIVWTAMCFKQEAGYVAERVCNLSCSRTLGFLVAGMDSNIELAISVIYSEEVKSDDAEPSSNSHSLTQKKRIFPKRNSNKLKGSHSLKTETMAEKQTTEGQGTPAPQKYIAGDLQKGAPIVERPKIYFPEVPDADKKPAVDFKYRYLSGSKIWSTHITGEDVMCLMESIHRLGTADNGMDILLCKFKRGVDERDFGIFLGYVSPELK
jgi:hypothetical protein